MESVFTGKSAQPIACDLLVFPKEKRLAHLEVAKEVLLRLPVRKTETAHGLVFHYEGDEDLFLKLAQWVSDEHRCCPWATYAIEAGPSVAGKPGVIKLSWGGSKDGKAFLSDALKYLESSGDSVPSEEILNSMAFTPGKPQTRKRMKRIGMGLLGLGLACLGCCLAPLLGIFAATVFGASVLAGILSKSFLIGLVLGAMFLSVCLIWKFRRKSCSPTSGSRCKSDQCGIHAPDSKAFP